jgi:O-antigen/teichoic acid export membrane protein
VAQAGYFILIARALGVEGYGALVAALAVIYILVPFAGLGADSVMIMHVARGPSSFPRFWGNAVLAILLTSIPLGLLAAAIGLWLVPGLSLRFLLTLAMAELLLVRLTEAAAHAFRAVSQLRIAAQLRLVPGTLRLATAGLFVALAGAPSAERWAVWNLGATTIAAAICLTVVTLRLGGPRLDPALLPRHLRHGVHFSLGLAAGSISADIDKAMLARLASIDAAGIYAAAYRAIGMAIVPIRSILYATDTRFFRHGEGGVSGSLRVAKRLLPFTASYGLLASVGLFLFAPLAPYALGQEYNASVDVLRWLAIVPLLQSVYYLGANTLMGAGHQAVRSLIQIAVAALNVLLNLWLIPRHGWQGAAWATLASEAALLAGLWAAVWFLSPVRNRKAVP